MKAAIIKELGQPPVYGTFEEPQPQQNEEVIEVLAAGIKQHDRSTAEGSHYSSSKNLPIVAGSDGVGRTADGKRVYFATFRRPYGAIAERTVASLKVPVPDEVDDATAAALINPGIGAWLPLHWRAELQPGETVLIIGATSTAGKLAIAAARQAGAGRIVGAARRPDALESLGLDATVDLNLQGDALKEAFVAAAGPGGYNVIVDYIWGPAAEALFAALGNHDLKSHARGGRGIRYVSVGSVAGPEIRLPAGILRSCDLRILGSGTGNFPPMPELKRYVAEILALAAKGVLTIQTEEHKLSEIAEVWNLHRTSDIRSVIRISR